MSSSPHDVPRLNRRDAIKWMLAASASVALTRALPAANQVQPPSQGGQPTLLPPPATPMKASGMGYGSDPDLVKTYRPGDFWPLTFTDAQRRTAAALCATIIPADDESPSAAQVGVPDFIDEWISAPYPGHDRDRATVLNGLQWLDTEAERRFAKKFAELSDAQTTTICNEICYIEKAAPDRKDAAEFFALYRNLTAGGFYTTAEGMKDLKYIGNIPTASFEGPPPEALKHVGLA